MAANDLEIVQQRVFNRAITLTAATTILAGEPIVVTGGAVPGRVTEAATNPATVLGVIAGTTVDADTGAAAPVGTSVTFYPAEPENEFKTTNFATDGNGTAAAPTIDNVGDSAGLILAGGTWSVDTGAGNGIIEVTEVLNRQGFNIDDPHTVDGTGAQVLFRFI